jgi:Guanylylate cyclase
MVCVSQVPHVRQAFNWDCGLACVLMVLQAAAPKAAGMDLATLRQYCPTTRCAPWSKFRASSTLQQSQSSLLL